MTHEPEPPTPVEVTNADPLPVSVVDPTPAPRRASERKAAETERAAVTHGQRRINLLWERTQAGIAILVTVTSLGIAAYKVVTTDDATAFVLLAGLSNLVIGFYFSRTNHEATGGPGQTVPGERR